MGQSMCRPGRTMWGLPFFGTTARSAVLSEGSLYSQYTAGCPGNAGNRNVLFSLIMAFYPNLFTSLFVFWSPTTISLFCVILILHWVRLRYLFPQILLDTCELRSYCRSFAWIHSEHCPLFVCYPDCMQVIMLDIGDVLYTTQQLNYIVLKHVNGVHINSSSRLFIKEIDYIYSNVDGNH